MPESFPEESNHAKKLMREGKFQESLKIINSLEKGSTLIPGDRLSLLILKGKIYTLTQRYRESVNVGRKTYHLSQSLGRLEDSITSLLIKANYVYFGQLNEALNYLIEAENLLNSLRNKSQSYISRQRANIFFKKAWAYFFKGEFNTALEIALNCLPLQEKLERKTEIAYTLQLLGDCYSTKGDYDIALDYTMKSMTLFKELENNVGLATALRAVGMIYYNKGDLDQALKYCKRSISSKSASSQTKLDSLIWIGQNYLTRGELDKVLKYYKQGITLANNENNFYHSAMFHALIGIIFNAKREFEHAIEYLKSALLIAEKINNVTALVFS